MKNIIGRKNVVGMKPPQPPSGTAPVLKSIQIAIFNSKIRSVRGFELQSYRLSQIAGIPMALLVKLLFLLIDMT